MSNSDLRFVYRDTFGNQVHSYRNMVISPFLSHNIHWVYAGQATLFCGQPATTVVMQQAIPGCHRTMLITQVNDWAYKTMRFHEIIEEVLTRAESLGQTVEFREIETDVFTYADANYDIINGHELTQGRHKTITGIKIFKYNNEKKLVIAHNYLGKTYCCIQKYSDDVYNLSGVGIYQHLKKKLNNDLAKNIFSYFSECCSKSYPELLCNDTKFIPARFTPELCVDRQNYHLYRTKYSMPVFGETDLADRLCEQYELNDVNMVRYIMKHPLMGKKAIKHKYNVDIERYKIKHLQEAYILVNNGLRSVSNVIKSREEEYKKLYYIGRSDEIIEKFEIDSKVNPVKIKKEDLNEILKYESYEQYTDTSNRGNIEKFDEAVKEWEEINKFCQDFPVKHDTGTIFEVVETNVKEINKKINAAKKRYRKSDNLREEKKLSTQKTIEDINKYLKTDMNKIKTASMSVYKTYYNNNECFKILSSRIKETDIKANRILRRTQNLKLKSNYIKSKQFDLTERITKIKERIATMKPVSTNKLKKSRFNINECISIRTHMEDNREKIVKQYFDDKKDFQYKRNKPWLYKKELTELLKKSDRRSYFRFGAKKDKKLVGLHQDLSRDIIKFDWDKKKQEKRILREEKMEQKNSVKKHFVLHITKHIKKYEEIDMEENIGFFGDDRDNGDY